MHLNLVRGVCPGKTEPHRGVLDVASVLVEFEPQCVPAQFFQATAHPKAGHDTGLQLHQRYPAAAWPAGAHRCHQQAGGEAVGDEGLGAVDHRRHRPAALWCAVLQGPGRSPARSTRCRPATGRWRAWAAAPAVQVGLQAVADVAPCLDAKRLDLFIHPGMAVRWGQPAHVVRSLSSRRCTSASGRSHSRTRGCTTCTPRQPLRRACHHGPSGSCAPWRPSGRG